MSVCLSHHVRGVNTERKRKLKDEPLDGNKVALKLLLKLIRHKNPSLSCDPSSDQSDSTVLWYEPFFMNLPSAFVFNCSFSSEFYCLFGASPDCAFPDWTE